MSTDTLIVPKIVRTQYKHHNAEQTKVFGLWVYLMSDCILFACLFATYAVLANGTAGGPSGKDIFEIPWVLTETFLLLFSSITCAMVMLSMNNGNIHGVNTWLSVTLLFGLSFIIMEIYECYHLIIKDFGPDRSAFLSSFFALIATHGIHISIGLIWIIILMIQVSIRGLTLINNTRLICLSLFWHFLDVIWIFIFTFIYLLGVI
ncbi:cytochrome o ubiquinol oxidase subunit III [Candidatus Gillettellia adelgis]